MVVDFSAQTYQFSDHSKKQLTQRKIPNHFKARWLVGIDECHHRKKLADDVTVHSDCGFPNFFPPF